jgi:hypothetical protein
VGRVVVHDNVVTTCIQTAAYSMCGVGYAFGYVKAKPLLNPIELITFHGVLLLIYVGLLRDVTVQDVSYKHRLMKSGPHAVLSEFALFTASKHIS